MLIDLHLYTDLSGGLAADRAIEAARAAGLDGVLVADQRNSASVAAIAARHPDFPVFAGVEIPTRAGDVILVTPNPDPFLTREEWRALLVLGTPTLEEVVEAVRAEGGVVLLAQPYDRSRRGGARDRVFALSGIAAVEAGSNSAEDGDNYLAMEALSRGTLNLVGGSAERRRRDGASGRFATLFTTRIGTQAELIEALQRGDCWPVEIGGRRREEAPRREDRGGFRRDDRGPRGEGRPDRREGDGRGPRRDAEGGSAVSAEGGPEGGAEGSGGGPVSDEARGDQRPDRRGGRPQGRGDRRPR